MTERDRPATRPDPESNPVEFDGFTCRACHGTGIVSRPYIGDLWVNWACECGVGERAAVVSEDEGADE